jgi:hypothetical protein
MCILRSYVRKLRPKRILYNRFQRAKPTGGSMRAHFYVSEADSSANLSAKGRQRSFVHTNSVQVR